MVRLERLRSMGLDLWAGLVLFGIFFIWGLF